MLAILIVIILFIFTPLPILSADWIFLQENDKGKFFYDAENMVTSSEETMGVWLKVVYSVKFKEKEGLKDLHHTVGFWEIHCRDKKIRLLLSSHFSEERQEETISPPRVFQTPDWEPIPTHSVLDALQRVICK
ncbi:MAG: surface-adhesin E family protein [Thermodesulfobacteriota bacterium]